MVQEPRYEVRAARWDGGWELHIDGVGVSQVLLLKDAHQQVCDYLDTIGAKRPYNIEINAAEQ